MKCSVICIKWKEWKCSKICLQVFLFNSKINCLYVVSQIVRQDCFVHCFSNLHFVFLIPFFKFWFMSWRGKKLTEDSLVCLTVIFFQCFFSQDYWETCFFSFPFVTEEWKRRLIKLIFWRVLGERKSNYLDNDQSYLCGEGIYF